MFLLLTMRPYGVPMNRKNARTVAWEYSAHFAEIELEDMFALAASARLTFVDEER